MPCPEGLLHNRAFPCRLGLSESRRDIYLSKYRLLSKTFLNYHRIMIISNMVLLTMGNTVFKQNITFIWSFFC